MLGYASLTTMVNLLVTPRIQDAVNAFNELQTCESDRISVADHISHQCLIRVSKCLVRSKANLWSSQYALPRLVQGSSISFPPKPQQPAKTANYVQLMSKLRAQQQELEYQRLIHPERSDISSVDDLQDISTPAQETKVLKEQLSTIVNIIISVVSVAYATWYWAGSSAGLPVASKLLLSLFTSIVILIAEVVIYLGYLNRVSQARTVERAKREKTQVIKSISFEGTKLTRREKST